MIDPKKTYRTRGGHEVRIYSIDGCVGKEVHGAFLNQDGWTLCSWPKSGLWKEGATDYLDLIEVKPRIKREIWVNVYPEMKGYSTHSSRAEADRYAAGNRIACVKVVVDCEEGEGL